MGRADSLTRSFAEESEQLVDLEVRSSMAGRWRMATIGIVMAAMPAAHLLGRGPRPPARRPAVSIGTLVAFVSLQQGLFRPAVSLLSTGVQMQTSLALFQRIFEYLDLPDRHHRAREPGPPRHGPRRGPLRGRRLPLRRTTAARPTLDGIDITVPAGGSLAVVGPTGSGKSTLSYLVPRLYDVTGGRVTIDGVDVRDLDFDTLAARGRRRLPGDVPLPRLGRRQPALRQAGRHRRGDCARRPRAAQIHDHIASLPDGYDTLVGERGYRFSGGEKQRLAIARTILRDPPVLILDEATSALDTRTEHAVQEAIDALSAGRTTHHHRPPPVHHPRRRPDRGPRRGARGRTGHARGTAGAGRALRGPRTPGRPAGADR